MKFPKSVLEIAKKANRRYPNDVQKAVDWAARNGQKLNDFDDAMPLLIRRGWQEVIYEDRHSVTQRIKREAGEYGGPAKVVSGLSSSVARASESVYLLYIAGKTLGEVLCEELVDIAQTERAIGDGHYFNARLCERLVPLVPKGKRVRDAVKEGRLREILCEVKEECDKKPEKTPEKAPEMELALAGH